MPEQYQPAHQGDAELRKLVQRLSPHGACLDGRKRGTVHAGPGGCGPGGWYDGHGWYSLIAPFIEENAWASTHSISNVRSAMRRRVRSHPSPFGSHDVAENPCVPIRYWLQRNEWNSTTWARTRTNYVVNAGNNVYGQYDVHVGTNVLRFLAALHSVAEGQRRRQNHRRSFEHADDIGNSGTSRTRQRAKVVALPGGAAPTPTRILPWVDRCLPA